MHLMLINDKQDSLRDIKNFLTRGYLEKHELNHFEDNRNTILDLLWSLTSEHEMARETH